jgi:UDP-MurNAc hydroxylase
MKITHYSNSFISVRSQDEHIVCDPWIGKANTGGWQSFPEYSVEQLARHLSDARWIYISHLHDDHFHPDTLKMLGLLDRDFVIKRFHAPVIRERLKKLGVTRIHEFEPLTVNRLGPFEVVIFPQMTSNSSGLEDEVNYDLDTSIAIKVEGKVFFNQVDNPLSLQDLTRIRDFMDDHLGAVDVACIMSGAASEYPHLFLGIDQAAEKRRIVESSLTDLCEWLRVLNPCYFFPAGGTYLIPGWMSVFNNNVAQPDFAEISRYVAAAGLPVQVCALEGGYFLELGEGQKAWRKGSDLLPIEANRQTAVEMHRQDRYHYETLEAPNWPGLLVLLDAVRHNWTCKVKKDSLKIHQAIRFDIYLEFRLDGTEPDTSLRLGTYQLCQPSSAEAGTLVIHIDYRALFGCIIRRFVWNGVLGSLCLYQRAPNYHYPTDMFSLNYLTLTPDQINKVALFSRS